MFILAPVTKIAAGKYKLWHFGHHQAGREANKSTLDKRANLNPCSGGYFVP